MISISPACGSDYDYRLAAEGDIQTGKDGTKLMVPDYAAGTVSYRKVGYMRLGGRGDRIMVTDSC